MSAITKGNGLEDELFLHLQEQKQAGSLLFEMYPAELSTIHKKKKYFSQANQCFVEFDVVVELIRPGATGPYQYVVFECKNHSAAINNGKVHEFASKLQSVFPRNSKGIIVITGRLQAGAEVVAKNQGIGVAKFDRNGVEITLDRTGRGIAEQQHIAAQMSDGSGKALKFSALCDDFYFGSSAELLNYIVQANEGSAAISQAFLSRCSPQVRYVPESEIKLLTSNLLSEIKYFDGAVELSKASNYLDLSVAYTAVQRVDAGGNTILGTASFHDRSILLTEQENVHRERFTVAHEIGHFYLNHQTYLLSDAVIEADLFTDLNTNHSLNYNRLEFQANLFAAHLLMPAKHFVEKVEEERKKLDLQDRGHGRVFVDDQPCNYLPYQRLLSELSVFFSISKQAAEVNLKRHRFLVDCRSNFRHLGPL